MPDMNPEQIRARVAELGDWFHNMDLKGVRTAPNHFLYDYPANKFARFEHAIPADMTGKSVLDIGCNAGFYSIEMKRRGADRVLCSAAMLRRAGFEIVDHPEEEVFRCRRGPPPKLGAAYPARPSGNGHDRSGDKA